MILDSEPLFELFNGCLSCAQIHDRLLIIRCLLLEYFLLGLDLLFDLPYFLLSLLDFLVRTCCRHFSILEVRLELVVARGQLLDLFNFLTLSRSFLLLLLSKSIE